MDEILEGLICQQCGTHIGFESQGLPRSCEDCEGVEVI